ncbi:hypothetical protein [Planctomyces sp. SH-PL62]|uniref:hypothetical protein n=1 Tax=Planctomyces sp. SH-PL62 TaxID=1636152 RepID=UPI00078DB192|nr:hypothetical protein [Planctomyces sp. SH-PL62]AMV40261.1 hypothetical protein VT85_22710 [Planctomyces sp. SH-PL62]
MFTWQTLRASDGRIETVDAWETLAAVIWEMACTSWEEPGNHWLSYVVDDAGQVVATALFGPEESLLVTISDGRQLCLPMPEFYRTESPCTHDGHGGF